MERFDARFDRKNGESSDTGFRRQEFKFSGEKIASFKVPSDGEERFGSIGIDFDLYLTDKGKLILIVENWSRRPGGRNYCVIETFDSLAEMKGRGIREDCYEVEMPEKLLRRAAEALRVRGLEYALEHAPLGRLWKGKDGFHRPS